MNQSGKWRYPSERTQRRLKQISDAIEEEVDRLGKVPPENRPSAHL
jgi:hypothetical protein